MLCNIIRCYAPFAQFAHCTGFSSAISHMHYTCINQYVNVAFSTLHAQETVSNLQHIYKKELPIVSKCTLYKLLLIAGMYD